MSKPQPDPTRDLPVIHLLPNLMTITAICAGLTAIRFGSQGDFETAVKLVLLAMVLDGLDGRLARLMNCQSSFGAELDSLADFVNFGVAPGLILYFWALHESSAGWLAVLGFVICCVLRLARFNVSSKADTEESQSNFFEGVPSPAGALLAMLPMYVSFLFSDMQLAPPIFVAGYLLAIGLLMISRVPTFSFKNISVPSGNAKFLMLGFVLLLSALLIYLWTTLALISITYIASLALAFRAARKST
ncbi:CDP-diacylglycerol--serine O-phosphatidyltransferase [Ruegeria meonggei]|uniref:CDP-diacylglycerol--serine O-phosphatidyltransferase n=1 Tax=Ruegeria meonggei TaxID=1446476 RepID=A0A1X7ACW2_9RHOB|nr:CDP-diacylglycerol--serine O-phosphatidyltransferase [Ruegeria meonggei]SLN75703.1 Phosphatidylcholine synthase [Ruegeria meonggei]